MGRDNPTRKKAPPAQQPDTAKTLNTPPLCKQCVWNNARQNGRTSCLFARCVVGDAGWKPRP